MNDEDLFLNCILLGDLKRINGYLSNKSFNASFENNYALRFCIIEKKPKIAQILMKNNRVSSIVCHEWIEECIKDNDVKKQLKIIFNVNNF
jgi:predicted RNA methylase